KAVCLILLNSPQVGRYGGKAAAPVFKSVVKRLLDAESELAQPEDEKPRTNNSIKNVLANLSEEEGLSTSNVSDETAREPRKERINIANKKLMPNLKSYNKREAVGILSQLGVKYKISGSGKVVSQSVPPGEIIKSGVVCILKCENQDFGAAVN
ncbi:MAG TPA: PASTA domain-containing protein, partial [Ignavibacteriales bacterium]|nr:PASTA domain-containing protein [Ignavibacteriales bacterium]